MSYRRNRIQKRNRIAYLDQLKAISILLVIIAHVCYYYIPGHINGSEVATFYDIICKVSIPLFMMVSGVLILGRKSDFINFVKLRFPRMLIPFFSWWIIFIVLALVTGNYVRTASVYHVSFITYIFKMLLGEPQYLGHFWFVWLMLSIYLVAPIINKWITKSSFDEVGIFLIIWFVTCIFTTFHLPYINIDLRYFAGPLGYFILGYYLHNKRSYILENKWIWPIVFIAVTIIRLTLPSNNILTAGTSDNSLYYNILIVFQAVSFFLTIKNFNYDSRTLNNKNNFFTTGFFSFAIISLSSNVYGIYLGHMLYYELLTPLFLINNFWLMIPLSGIFILLLTWATMLVFNEIPILRALTGRIRYKNTR